MHICKLNANIFSLFIIKNIFKTINPCIVIKMLRQTFTLIYFNLIMINLFHNTLPYKYLLPNQVVFHTSNTYNIFCCICFHYKSRIKIIISFNIT